MINMITKKCGLCWYENKNVCLVINMITKKCGLCWYENKKVCRVLIWLQKATMPQDWHFPWEMERSAVILQKCFYKNMLHKNTFTKICCKKILLQKYVAKKYFYKRKLQKNAFPKIYCKNTFKKGNCTNAFQKEDSFYRFPHLLSKR